MAAGLKVGDRVTVGTLHPLSRIDPAMKLYAAEAGTVVLELPAEMSFGKMYRIDFDNPALESLAFLGKELNRL